MRDSRVQFVLINDGLVIIISQQRSEKSLFSFCDPETSVSPSSDDSFAPEMVQNLEKWWKMFLPN